jgi:ribosome-associated protein
LKLQSLPQGVRLAVEAAQSKKAAGITVLDLKELGAFTQYFVICTGFSTPQVQAILSEIEEQVYKEMKRSPEHREGRGSAEWALLDYGAFIVHVFGEQARRFYDLERLWRSAPKLVLPDAPEGPHGRPAFSATERAELRGADVQGGEMSSADDAVAP